MDGDTRYESIILDLSSNEGKKPEVGKPIVTSLDLHKSRLNESKKKLHIILLDDGRKKILQSDFSDLFYCIGCRACIKKCPTYNFYKGELKRSPKEYLNSFLLGKISSLNMCVNCLNCYIECPVIDLPKLITRAKADLVSKKGQSLDNKILANYSLLGKLSSFTSPFQT